MSVSSYLYPRDMLFVIASCVQLGGKKVSVPGTVTSSKVPYPVSRKKRRTSFALGFIPSNRGEGSERFEVSTGGGSERFEGTIFKSGTYV